MLGRLGETVTITRTNNRKAIEHETAREGDSRVEYVFVDLSRRATWWKRGQRGVRLYYVLWQLAALREARRLADERPFDLVWHLTLANAWIGSTASLLGIPFVYGPVGGAFDRHCGSSERSVLVGLSTSSCAPPPEAWADTSIPWHAYRGAARH